MTPPEPQRPRGWRNPRSATANPGEASPPGEPVPSGAPAGRGPRSLSLKGRALRLLSMREHARAELARKLAPHATPEDDLPSLLTDLETSGWLSNERAAASLVRQKAAQWGSLRVKQALQAKGLPAEVVGQAMAQLPEAGGSEEARAAQVWLRKFGTPATDMAVRAKQFRFLLTRGFSSHTASAVLKHAEAVADGTWPDDTQNPA